jgi:hypothetical protein
MVCWRTRRASPGRGSSLTLGELSQIRHIARISLAARFERAETNRTLLPRARRVPASRATSGGKVKALINRQMMIRNMPVAEPHVSSAVGGGRASIGQKPNKAPEPTTLLVTSRAAARAAPSRVVAHL